MRKRSTSFPAFIAGLCLGLICIALLMVQDSLAESQPKWALNKSHEPGELIVRFNTAMSEEEVRDFCASQDVAAVTKLGPNMYRLAFSVMRPIADVLADLNAQADVDYVEPNYLMFAVAIPNDAGFSSLYGMHNTGQTGGTPDADIDAAEAWDIRTDASSLIVAVIDTGVDHTHPDLAANMWTNSAEIAGNGVDDDGNGYVDDVHGYDFVNHDGNPMDDNVHGTHVAGTIGGVGNNGIGVAGVAWKAKIMALKFLSAGGSGSISDAILALNYATQMGAKISSNSWGGGGYSQAMKDAIDAAAAKGFLFIAAAGNSASNNDTALFYPASYASENIISVAASDSKDALASFSNYGATTVDLAAPGVGTYSTAPNNAYQSLSGTSMATPHVSGAAAILWAQFPGLNYAQIKQKLLSTADAVPAFAGKMVSGGRLNLHRALLVGSETVPPAAVNNLSVVSGTLDALTLSWTATGDNGNTGTAKSYDIRYSTQPIDASNFAAAKAVAGAPEPRQAGIKETMTFSGLNQETTYYVAMKVTDAAGNTSGISNTAGGATSKGFLLYEENCESGAAGWTATGLWHVSGSRSNSPAKAWYFGDETKKTYETPAGQNKSYGVLTSPKINLGNVGSAVLEFSGWRQVEEYSGTFDKTYVEISADNGTTWKQIWYLDSNSPSTSAWETKAGISLAAYIGKEVLLRFTFDTGDIHFNSYEGWYVDDIRIWSDSLTDVTPPVAPTGVKVTDPGTGTGLTIAWTANTESDLGGYHVHRNGAKLNATAVSATSYADSGLTPGTSYAYTVSAVDLKGNEGPVSAAATGVPGAPAAPNFTGAYGQDAWVQLVWSVNTEGDLAGYNVYRDTVKINAGLVAPSAKSYKDLNLKNGMTYAYAITAVDQSGNESAKSKTLNATPSDTTAPAAPTGLQGSDPGTGTTAVLNWNANGEADLAGYDLYRGASKANASLISGTSFTDSGLTAKTPYVYTVKAVDTSGNTGSASAAVTLIPGAPGVPSGLVVSAASKTAALSWSANTEADLAGYHVYRDGIKITAGLLSVPSYKDTGLTNGKTYGYQISAVDSFGNASALSNVVQAKPEAGAAPAAPKGLAVSDPGSGTVLNLIWSANTEGDLAGYNVYRNGAKVSAGAVTTPAFADSGLIKGTAYAYTVTAINADGAESAASASATGVPGAPAAPALTTVTGGDGIANLTWNANSEPDLAGYSVYRDGVKISANLLSGVSYQDTGLKNGVTYSYQLSATDTFGNESAKGDAKTVVPKDAAAPGAPQGLIVQDPGTDTTLNMTWTANAESDIAGYNVYRDGTKVNGSLLTAANFSDTGLSKGVSYSYGVKAQDTSGNESAASTTVNGIPGAPSVPVIGSAAGGDGSVALAWSASPEADLSGYNVYRDGLKANGSLLKTASYQDTNLKNGTSYSYQVSAVDSFNNESAKSGAASATPKDATAPGAPTGLMVADPGSGSALNVQWTANPESDVTAYAVYRDGSKIVTATSAQYADTGLAQGVNYSYTVKALDSSGNESAASASVGAAPGAPKTPVLQSASAANAAAVLKWAANAETDLAGYHVYQKVITYVAGGGTKFGGGGTVPVAGYQQITAAPVNAGSYKVSGLTNGQSYTFAIAAADSSGWISAKSNEQSVTPNPSAVPPATALKISDPGTGTQLVLSWEASAATDLAGYSVYRDGALLNAVPLAAVSYQDAALNKGQVYSYYVRAVGSDGTQSDATATVKGVPGAPSVPSGAAAAAADVSVQLNWTANVEADLAGYNVYRDGVKANSSLLTTASFKDSGLKNGTPYSYQLTALDTHQNESAKSAAISATPKDASAPGVPTGLTVADPGNGNSLNLSWAGAADADLAGYNVYRNGVKRNASPLAVTTYADTGLTSGIAYDYTVKSVDTSSNESAASATATGVPGAPAIPVLNAATAGDAAVTLAWTANTEKDFATYAVYRNGQKLNTGVLTVNAYSDSGLANGSKYTYSVSAADKSGNESVKSNSLEATPKDTAAPAAPSGLAVNDPGNGSSVTLSWAANAESDIAGYNVYREGGKRNAALITGTSYADDGMIKGAMYHFTLKAQDASGNESPASASVAAVPGAPATPSGFAAGAASKTVALSWTANAEADLAGYNLYRDGVKINAALLTGISYKDSNLSNGSTYAYRLSAVDANGNESAQTNPVSAAPKAGAAPTAPTGLTLNDGGSGAILDIAWTANTEADLAGYNVYRNGAKINGALLTAAQYSDTTVSKGNAYVYTVKAVNTDEVESSASAGVTGIPGAPSTPVIASATGSDGAVDLTWSASPEADLSGYNVYRDGVKVNIGLISAANFKDTGLKNGVSYAYQVSALDSFNNESAKSGTSSATPKDAIAPSAPQGLTLQDPGTGTTLSVSWTANTEGDIAGYNVYRNGSKVNGSLLNTVNFADSGLSKGISYSYTVKAQDTSGNEGSASTTVSGIPGSPSTPVIASATGGDGAVDLTWSASPEADLSGYNVYRDGVKVNIGLVSAANFKDTGLKNGTSYSYQVSALDSFNNESAKSGASNVIPKDSIAPSAPQGLTLQDPGTGTTLSVSWTANTEGDIAGYNVYRNGSKVNGSLLNTVNFADSGLSKGISYSYTVKAQDTSGNESSTSTTASGIPGSPSTPVIASATGGDGAVDLTWSASPEADLSGYNVYRDGVKVNIGLVSAANFKDTGLKNGTSYSYQVSALDSFNNESAKSGASNVTPKDSIAPSAPQGLTLQDPGTGNTLNLTWTANAEGDIAGYNVYRNGSKVNGSLLTTAGFVDSGLSKGTSYGYSVKAQDTSGNEGAASAAVSGAPGAPAAPELLSATAGNGSVLLAWTANKESDLAGYDVYEKVLVYAPPAGGTKFGGGGTPVYAYQLRLGANGKSTSAILTGLTNGQSYAFVIVAKDNFGNISGYSNELQAMPLSTLSSPSSSAEKAEEAPQESASPAAVLPPVLISGDVNGDGHADLFLGDKLLMSKSQDNSLAYADATAQWFAEIPTQVVMAAIADFNGDNQPDLLVIQQAAENFSATAKAVLYRNDQNSRFIAEAFVALAAISLPVSFGAEDLNSDGHIDLALGLSDSLEIWTNDGKGAFALSNSLKSLSGGKGSASALAFSDIDADGRKDIVCAADNVIVWFQAGFGQFEEDAGRFDPTGTVTQIKAKDMDNDGKEDFLFLKADGSFSLQRNNGKGYCVDKTAAMGLEGVQGIRCFDMADMNADGKMDIAAGKAEDAAMLWFQNEGVFQDESVSRFKDTYTLTSDALQLMDLNNDGYPEIVRLGYDSSGRQTRTVSLSSQGYYLYGTVPLEDWVK